MAFLCEFEMFRDRSGLFHAVPYGLSGEVTAKNYRDLCQSAVEWLGEQARERLDNDQPLPELSLGNFPKGGGRIILIAIDPTPTPTRAPLASITDEGAEADLATPTPASATALADGPDGTPAVQKIVVTAPDPESSKVVTASQAAEILGVSRSRISQMTRAGILSGYRKGRDAFVTIESINARLLKGARPGRAPASKPESEE